MDEQKKNDLENGVNQGVVAPSQDETLAQGDLDMSGFPIVASDSNLDKFLSDFDAQFLNGFDTLGCNIFSSVGAAEMYMNALGEKMYLGPLGKTEFSERKACVDAGLDGSKGSSEQDWETAINLFGLVKHADWPFDQNTVKVQFFSPETPQIIQEGKDFLKRYTPFHRYIPVSQIEEALRYGPVKIFIGTGNGWNTDENDGVVPKTSNPMNHAVIVRKIDDKGIHIHDQYFPFLKCLAPDYVIYYAFQTLFKRTFTYQFNRDLGYGSYDSDNVQLQIALTIDGEFPPQVMYSNHFGPNTLQAVQKFQVKYGIANPGEPGYGRCGPKTRAKLNEIFQ